MLDVEQPVRLGWKTERLGRAERESTSCRHSDSSRPNRPVHVGAVFRASSRQRTPSSADDRVSHLLGEV